MSVCALIYHSFSPSRLLDSPEGPSCWQCMARHVYIRVYMCVCEGADGGLHTCMWKCIYAYTYMCTHIHIMCVCVCVHLFIIIYHLQQRRLQDCSEGPSCWQCMADNKVLTVLSTTSQPVATGTVHRQKKDGSRAPVECPDNIILYNKYMGGIDRGDQLRGCYCCRTKSRKFYKYQFYFLFDVAITNAFILYKHLKDCPQPPAKRSRRGRCVYCSQHSHKRTDSSWRCQQCGVWLCHDGKPQTDFYLWHKNL